MQGPLGGAVAGWVRKAGCGHAGGTCPPSAPCIPCSHTHGCSRGSCGSRGCTPGRRRPCSQHGSGTSRLPRTAGPGHPVGRRCRLQATRGQALGIRGWPSGSTRAPPQTSAHRDSRGSRGGPGGSGHSEGRRTPAGRGSGQPRHSPRAGSPQGCSHTLGSEAARGGPLSQAGRPPSPPPTHARGGGPTHAGREGSGSSPAHSGRTRRPRSPPGRCTGPSPGHSPRPPLRGWNTGTLQGGNVVSVGEGTGPQGPRKGSRGHTHAGSRGRRSPGRRARSGRPGSRVCTRSVPAAGPGGRRCPGSRRRCSHSLGGKGGEGASGACRPQAPTGHCPPQTRLLTLLCCTHTTKRPKWPEGRAEASGKAPAMNQGAQRTCN